MTDLSARIHTFGRAMLARHGERVHKIALDAGFTCPSSTALPMNWNGAIAGTVHWQSEAG